MTGKRVGRLETSTNPLSISCFYPPRTLPEIISTLWTEGGFLFGVSRTSTNHNNLICFPPSHKRGVICAGNMSTIKS